MRGRCLCRHFEPRKSLTGPFRVQGTGNRIHRRRRGDRPRDRERLVSAAIHGLVGWSTPVSRLRCCRPAPRRLNSQGLSRSTEEFSYFTLCQKVSPTTPATSLFGIACSRQIDSNRLINRSPDVTRSTVQKAVVVVTDSPQSVGQLREKLSVVTSAWFAQRYGHSLCSRQDASYELEWVILTRG
jgi:hypothetical protein